MACMTAADLAPRSHSCPPFAPLHPLPPSPHSFSLVAAQHISYFIWCVLLLLAVCTANVSLRTKAGNCYAFQKCLMALLQLLALAYMLRMWHMVLSVQDCIQRRSRYVCNGNQNIFINIDQGSW